jgi:hypothetical protein
VEEVIGLDFSEIQKHMELQAKEALRVVGLEIEAIIKKYIKRLWYDRTFNNKHQYTRTYDYINSLTVSPVKTIASGQYEITIYFDTNKIKPREPDGLDRWSSHQNITNGQSSAQFIPEWIEYGQKSKIYSYAGAYPMTHALEEIRQTQFHIRRIQSILASKGIIVGVTGYVKLKRM